MFEIGDIALSLKPKLHWKDFLDVIPKDISTKTCPQPSTLSIDSRQCSKNHWFLPIKGQIFDGHNFLTKDFTQQIAGFFYRKSHPKSKEFHALGGVGVDDTLVFLGAFARSWRRKNSAKIIAITGSTGKTTVKNICEELLKTQHKTLAPKGSMNNEVGVPLTLLQITSDTNWAVIEMGARKQNDIGYLAEIAEPDICCVLNATNTHIEIFGNRETLLKTKCEMFHKTTKSTVAVAPVFDPKILKETANHETVITFGDSDKADIFYSNQRWQQGKQSFDLHIKNHSIPIESDYLHESLGLNTTAAVALCQHAEISFSNIQRALQNLQPANGRFQKIESKEKTLVHDAYNASPSSMSAGLSTLERCFTSASKLIVLGDMLELGKDSKDYHEKISEDLKKISEIRLLVLVGLEMKHLFKGLQNTFPVKYFLTIDDVSSQALNEVSWDVAYFKASNSMNFDRLIKDIQN